jgi:hypothetical protein
MKDSQDVVTGSQNGSQNEVSPKNDLVVAHDGGDNIEEGAAAYHPGGFHPIHIGDIFNDRYEVKNKIGYGVYSTVWLVRDLKNQYVSSTTLYDQLDEPLVNFLY